MEGNGSRYRLRKVDEPDPAGLRNSLKTGRSPAVGHLRKMSLLFRSP